MANTDFLRKHGARTRFSLGLDRGTSYAAVRQLLPIGIFEMEMKKP